MCKQGSCKEFDLLETFLVCRPLQTCFAGLQMLGGGGGEGRGFGAMFAKPPKVQLKLAILKATWNALVVSHTEPLLHVLGGGRVE